MIELKRLDAAMALVLAFGLLGCERQSDPKGYTGYVEAEYVYAGAPDTGWLVQAPLREGDQVAVDDLLFALDHDFQDARVKEASDRLRQAEAGAKDIATGARKQEIAALDAKLREAKASANLAEAERTRWVELVARDVAPQERADRVIAEHDAAVARVRTIEADIAVAHLAGREAARAAAAAASDAASAVLSQAEWQLDQRQVRAKVAGRVEEVFHREGEFVTRANPIVAILPEDAIKVRFFVPQAELSSFEPGMTVDVAVDGESEPITASISFIAKEAEFTPPVIYSVDSREKLVFLLEAQVQAPGSLRPGQPVTVLRP